MNPKYWKNALDVGSPPKACIQRDTFTKGTIGQSEDCLFATVQTDDVKGKKPVMVFIHGGGFEIGTTTTYNGRVLAKKGVVYVSIQYRLDVLGFLVTDESEGNYGLQDQRFALAWVERNIHHFGGDPKKITLFGESAGALSGDLSFFSCFSLSITYVMKC